MPGHPRCSDLVRALPSSVWGQLGPLVAARLREGGELFPLHLGETHRAPPAAARLERVAWPEGEGAYRYGAFGGERPLRAALEDKLRARNGLPDGTALMVTLGATHALALAARAIVGPGDEVLVPSPYWPLVPGIVTSAGARPIEVPVGDRLAAEPDADLAALLEPALSPRTAAIYACTPNNPDGTVLSARQIDGLVALARARSLWLLADEVYEDYLFERGPHRSIAAAAGAAERTLTAFSFSKSVGLSGLRIGYLAGPPELIAAATHLSHYDVYNAPAAMQRVALAAHEEAEPWIAAAHADYRAARDETVAALAAAGLPTPRPAGGAYVLVDLDRALGGQPLEALFAALAAAGVLVAPGWAFGAAFSRRVRICYTAAPRPVLRAGLARLGEVVRAFAARHGGALG